MPAGADSAPGASTGRTLAPWLAPALGVTLVLLATSATYRADRDEARRLVSRELYASLVPGEPVWRTVPATEREWHDLYRTTYGMLAATDRRVLFVGVRPELALPDDGARAFDVESFPYDATFTIAPAWVPPAERGVRVGSAEHHQHFGVARGEQSRLRSLVVLATRRAAALARARARARRFRDSVAALPPLREYYTVRRGDALITIAHRYGTTAARIRALNGLADDRIIVGQDLLVREIPRPIPPCPPAVCEVVMASTGEVEPGPARVTPHPPESTAQHPTP